MTSASRPADPATRRGSAVTRSRSSAQYRGESRIDRELETRLLQAQLQSLKSWTSTQMKNTVRAAVTRIYAVQENIGLLQPIRRAGIGGAGLRERSPGSAVSR